MSGSFVLIASYPRSGNTWARIVFEKLRRGSNLSINALDGNLYGAERRLMFDTFSPVNAADLLPEEVEEFLPHVYRRFAEAISDTIFVKVHECARIKGGAGLLYPPEYVKSVLYFVRHPFDVAVSVAHHYALSLEAAVDLMADARAMPLAFTWLPEALPQYFGSWNDNVTSWIDSKSYQVTLARYEDLHRDPVAQFSRLAIAAGLAAPERQVAEAVEASRFERLKSEEEEHGFRERPSASPSFFRSGRARSWEGVLGSDLRERLVRQHEEVMERLGYTAEGGVVDLPVR